MICHILAVGDVVGEQGLAHLEASLRPLKKLKDIHFTVVNGENVSVSGVTEEQVGRIYTAGADVVTLGNHTFGKPQLASRLTAIPISSVLPIIPGAHQERVWVFMTAAGCGLA